MLKSLYRYSLAELKEIVTLYGEKPFRAKQIAKFLYGGECASIEDMHNLPKSLKTTLIADDYCVFDMKVVLKQVSSNQKTKKFLLELVDGNQIEAVLMEYHHGYSVCISTQVGCKMGCSFCASTIDGLARNLLAYELWQQILLINYSEKIRISNVVLMGSGEPLDNYSAVIEFIKTIGSLEHLGIGQRHITVSTCGLVDQINRLAREELQINLAVSLHSPFDDKRSKIVPINAKYGLEQLLMSIDNYFNLTKRRVTIEYTLIAGENDDFEHSAELIRLFQGKNIHINLIPLNIVAERDYLPSEDKMVKAFKKRLQKAGLNATIRRELGDDIDAACGQLRRKRKVQVLE